MLSNRVKRNVWLVFAIASFAMIVASIIGLVTGDREWYNVLNACVLFAVCIYFYLGYRKDVKAGILFGRHNKKLQ